MKNLKRKTLLASILTLAIPALAAQFAVGQISNHPADAQKDPVLKAMLEELDRSRRQLQLQDMQKPFFIQYALDDLDNYDAYVIYGALSVQREQHRCVVRVTVRIGDYKTDSSPANQGNEGALQIAAVDDNPAALRFALWAATDLAYKSALNAYTQKQAALKAVQTPAGADDFSREKPVISIGPPASFNLDRKLWIDRVSAATTLDSASTNAGIGAIEEINGRISARVLNRYLVNSEGTIVRKGTSEYMAGVTASTQASDGMRLERDYYTSAPVQEQLDSADKFRAGVLGILSSLHDLASAPVVPGEYHGPVLFSGDASSDIFARLVAPSVAAFRPDLGIAERTRGPYSSGYQTRVLPEFLTVVDDPTRTTFDGKGLLGSYAIDDDGVPASGVTLVDQGKLVNYLIGRQPVKDFPASNGHGRASAGGSARPGASVLHVEAQNPVSAEVLNQKLLAIGKEQGLSAVYAVDTFGANLSPRLLYRIDVATGKRELVRGGALSDLDQRSLRSGIRAAGDKTYVDNKFGDPATTILAPPLLIDDITIKRAEQRNDKLPYYPPPD
jgi:hypothetical protein